MTFAMANTIGMRRLLGGLATGTLAGLMAVPALAVEVYQWTDEAGVVHFSQWAPEDDVEGVETVSVAGGESDNGIGVSEQDDPDGYRAHREEMDALWADIDARREAARTPPEPPPGPEIIYVNSEPDYAVPYYPPLLRPYPRPPGPKPWPRPRSGGEEPDPPANSLPFKKP
jgi:hypothetical protein